MPLPPILTKFTTVSPIIASFDGSSVATGQQFITFFLADAIKGAATNEKFLTEQTIYSENGKTAISAATTDIDFDILFTKTVTLEGDATFVIWAAHTGTSTFDVQVNLKRVLKDTTEVQIGTEVSSSLSFNNSEDGFMGIYTIPLTTLNKGEKLRLSFTAATGTYTLSHDPKNRTSSSAIGAPTATDSLINIPLQI